MEQVRRFVFGKNWRTTLIGIVGGLIPILEAVYRAMEQGQSVDWGLVSLGIAIMVLGKLSKDAGVSGTER